MYGLISTEATEGKLRRESYPMAHHLDTREQKKARGILYGLAIGDALGYPVEFMELARIKRRYGPGGITDLPDPALFSDDTQMSVALAEALLRAGEKDLQTLMGAVQEEFIQWRHSPENNRAPGRTCLRGVERMEQGIPWWESGDAGSKGCGSAMRAAPIGYLFQHAPERLREVAHATGICTHGHPTAGAACIGAAYLVKLALDGVQTEDMIPALLKFTAGISEEFDRAIFKVRDCLGWADEEQALAHLGEGWIGEEAVALALYSFLRNPESFEKTIIRGANTNGDSDSVACIAGAISGAYMGIGAIPAGWVRRIEKSTYLAYLADRLAEKKDSIREGMERLRKTMPDALLSQMPRTRDDKFPVSAVPFKRSYWVVPGKLLAGCYPGSPDPDEAREKLRGLLECGIRHVINLMYPDEKSRGGLPFRPYEGPMQFIAAAVGLKASFERLPIEDLDVPTRIHMVRILDQVDRAIKEGKPVYVHCWGGRGRTGTVVGCYLARHGYAAGRAVLKLIEALRKGTEDADMPSPEAWDQIEMVTSWVEAE